MGNQGRDFYNKQAVPTNNRLLFYSSCGTETGWLTGGSHGFPLLSPLIQFFEKGISWDVRNLVAMNHSHFREDQPSLLTSIFDTFPVTPIEIPTLGLLYQLWGANN